MTSSFDFLDLPIQRALTSFVGSCPDFDRAVYAVSHYDTFKGSLLFSFLWLIWFFKDEGRDSFDIKERRTRLVVVFWGTIAAVAMARLLQKLLDVHQRPLHMELSEQGVHFPAFLDPSLFNTWNSFPSDHAIYFTALSVGLCLVHRTIGLLSIFWSVFVIFLPRLYLGIHHPSDVIVGMFLGAVFIFAIARSKAVLLAGRRLVDWGEKNQGLFYWLAFLLTLQAAHLFDDMRGVGSAVFHYVRSL